MIESAAVSWGLAAAAFALCAGGAAWGVERLLLARGAARRHPWTVALLLALGWPPLAYVVTTQSPAPIDVELVAPPVASASPGGAFVPATADGAPLDPQSWVLIAWGVLSALVALHAWRGWRALVRERHAAEPCLLGTTRVYRTSVAGPAVFGLRDPILLMPSWVWELEPSLQALVLRHELEHCRARDARLVWLAVIARIAMPWNLAVWWIGHRLRLALEMDCDARTLRADPSQGAHYAHLLLLITQLRQRAHARAAHFAPALLPLPSHLRRRISAMHPSPMSNRPLQRCIALAVVGAAILSACSRQIAGNLAGPANAPSPVVVREESQNTERGATAATDKPFFDFQVEQPATSVREGSTFPAYPPALKAAKVTGTVLAQFVVGVDGTVEPGSARVLRTSEPAFGEAVLDALPGMRFRPATIGGRAVRQLVQQPFTFAVDGTPPARLDSLNTEAVRAGPAPKRPADTSAARTAVIVQVGTPTYFDFQVERPAIIAPGNAGPAYPAELRASGVEGSVVVQFVVDANGTLDAESLKVLKSDHEEFTQAVRTALGRMRFLPATVQGRPVRQLMQQPFEFRLAR